MPTPPRPDHIWPLAFVALALTVVLVAAGGRLEARTTDEATRVSWAGLAGAPRPRVAIGQRMIVVLRTPSLAERVAAAGGRAADADQRRWTAQARATEQLVLSKLGVQGLPVTPDYTFERVLTGFSAALDPRAIAILERLPEVQGVYPVRSAFPASVSSSLLRERDFQPGSGHRLDVALPGFDGRGVTVALLDTGVDRAQPYLRGRIKDGVDIVGGSDLALAAPHPDNEAELERHGTELAGIIVGASGPADLSGIATGAWVLPIRVAGWQRAASGRYAVYARTDQILAGLERAVDPNGDGVAHDAARIAVVGVAEPYSAFADGPLAKAVSGALRLDTLVIAPVGNDGLGSSSDALRDYGSVAGPGGAPAALTVGAVDLRRRSQRRARHAPRGARARVRGADPARWRRAAGRSAQPRGRGAARGASGAEAVGRGHRGVLRRQGVQQGREPRCADPRGRVAAGRRRERRARGSGRDRPLRRRADAERLARPRRGRSGSRRRDLASGRAPRARLDARRREARAVDRLDARAHELEPASRLDVFLGRPRVRRSREARRRRAGRRDRHLRARCELRRHVALRHRQRVERCGCRRRGCRRAARARASVTWMRARSAACSRTLRDHCPTARSRRRARACSTSALPRRRSSRRAPARSRSVAQTTSAGSR